LRYGALRVSEPERQGESDQGEPEGDIHSAALIAISAQPVNRADLYPPVFQGLGKPD
jgi:hypothetical protein